MNRRRRTEHSDKKWSEFVYEFFLETLEVVDPYDMYPLVPTQREVQRKTNLSAETIVDRLKEHVKKGEAITVGKGRHRRYLLTPKIIDAYGLPFPKELSKDPRTAHKELMAFESPKHALARYRVFSEAQKASDKLVSEALKSVEKREKEARAKVEVAFSPLDNIFPQDTAHWLLERPAE